LSKSNKWQSLKKQRVPASIANWRKYKIQKRKTKYNNNNNNGKNNGNQKIKIMGGTNCPMHNPSVNDMNTNVSKLENKRKRRIGGSESPFVLTGDILSNQKIGDMSISTLRLESIKISRIIRRALKCGKAPPGNLKYRLHLIKRKIQQNNVPRRQLNIDSLLQDVLKGIWNPSNT
jgi:hypothetical protein